MKVEKQHKQFEPVIITLETEEDKVFMADILQYFLKRHPLSAYTLFGEKATELLGKLND